MTKHVAVVIVLVFLAPTIGLLSIGLLFTTAPLAACTPASSLILGPIPDTLTATTRAGQTLTMNHHQLTHAATIITVGGQTDGVGQSGIVIAVMAALTESRLRMLANPSAYPESANYPNDGNETDYDSLGLFQLRARTGWGTVPELMDPTYQARAFFGGPTGPNHPSPPGLLDVPGWQRLDPGAAAQAVEVSAYPDRYQNYQPVAETIVAALTRPSPNTVQPATTEMSASSRVLFPLPSGTWVQTGGYGGRVHPITGAWKLHTGTDYAASPGTPILAAADGQVTHAGMSGTYGGLIVIEHMIGGEQVASAYAHMWEDGIHVTEGSRVTAGQHIGDVGSAGYSTGPHLHFEIRPGGSTSPAIDAELWLTGHGAEPTDTALAPDPECRPDTDRTTGTSGGKDPAPLVTAQAWR